MWTFHSVNKDNYYISSQVGGETKYLRIGAEGLSLVDKTEASVIKFTPGSGTRDGKFKLTSGNYAVSCEGANGFKSATSSDNDKQWLSFAELSELTSDDFVVYTADKISISEVPDGARVIVYTRVWDDVKKKYFFFAIDQDGSLLPCFERGDTLQWDFTEYQYSDGTPNYYYELQNIYSEKYIAPQIENHQILSNSKIGINLPGRREGEYYSDILAWDDEYYSFAGIRANDTNEQIESCAKSKADTFYFAIMEDTVPQLTKVSTIDNDKYGISLKMIDYPSRDYQKAVLVNDDYFPTTGVKNLLSTNLEDNGYPRAMNADSNQIYHSLSELYSEATGGITETEVNHLFIESTYNATGYFEFDSCQNFATLMDENGQKTNTFTVYKELGTSDNDSRTTLKHGQFFPYDSIKAGVYSKSNPVNLYSVKAVPGENNTGVLPDDDPRKFEKLLTVGNKPNYHNGMEMSASFVQTPSGKDAWGHDIIFEFTGDDDFWLYVDKELVIDLGGVHSALEGNVNFATGIVKVNGVTKTLRQIFEENYRSRNPQATDADVTAYLREYFEDGEDIFKDYSSHTMKIFYMERGAGASNLHMRFNLSSVTPGNVVLKKEVSGTSDLDFNLVEYPFMIEYLDSDVPGAEWKKLSNYDANVYVTYQNSVKRVTFKSTYSPPDTVKEYNNVYFISPDKPVEIHFPSDIIKYRITECAINEEVYDSVYINGTRKVVTDYIEAGSMRKDYITSEATVEERPNVTYRNNVDPTGLRTLSVKKLLLDETGNNIDADDDSSVFSFRLSFAKEGEDNLTLANMVKYNVRDLYKNYCKWGVIPGTTKKGFVSIGKSNYSDLSESEKESVTFETSMNGSISKIPAGYTVEVRNLPVGIKFKVEERDNDVPLGYSRVKYQLETEQSISEGKNEDYIRKTFSPTVNVINQRGWELEVNKEWSDKDFTTSHDPIYTAVYISDSNTPVAGTIRRIDGSTRYFFAALEDGHSFNEYAVCEVVVDNPIVDEAGNVTDYTAVRRLNEGDPTYIQATTKGSSEKTSFPYVVSYTQGTAEKSTDNAALDHENVRTDLITNTRGGGIVINLFDMLTKEVLPGGIFTLKKEGEDTILGTFESDSHGRVTVIYDFVRDTNYVITQTVAPNGYIGLPNAVTFSVDNNDIVQISGNTSEWEELRQNTGQSTYGLIAYIDLYNKPYSLKAIKTDSVTNQPIEGAKFALYKAVLGNNGYTKDYFPISGMEEIITGTDGVIAGIDKTLAPGTYYLTETVAADGYKKLTKDVVFTISETGVISLTGVQSGKLSCTEIDLTNPASSYQYIINVPNSQGSDEALLTVTKEINGNMGNKTKLFSFTFATTVGDDTKYDYSLLTSDGNTQTGKVKSGDSFELGHEDSITIVLPKNTEVTISEDNEGYVSSFKLGSLGAENVNEKTFTVVEDTALVVTNTLNAEIPTGVSIPVGMLVLAGLIAFGGIFGTIMRQKKMKEWL